MGAFGYNGPEIIGRESGFTVAGHKKKCKAAEKRVVAAGDEKTVLKVAGTHTLQTYVDMIQATVAEWVELQPSF